jgi:hypothetical protein
MRRVQVQLTDDQLTALRRHATATGEGLASVVRKAVDDWVRREDREALVERAIGGIGGFHSGIGDLAERHDDYLDEEPTA